jgi:hypothetical protein
MLHTLIGAGIAVIPLLLGLGPSGIGFDRYSEDFEGQSLVFQAATSLRLA